MSLVRVYLNIWPKLYIHDTLVIRERGKLTSGKLYDDIQPV